MGFQGRLDDDGPDYEFIKREIQREDRLFELAKKGIEKYIYLSIQGWGEVPKVKEVIETFGLTPQEAKKMKLEELIEKVDDSI